MRLQAGQTSEQNKSGKQTARGSISKTEQKIGFPHSPVALGAPQTAKNKATLPGICDAGVSESLQGQPPSGHLSIILASLSLPLQHGFPQHKEGSRNEKNISADQEAETDVPPQGCGLELENQTCR